MADNKTNQSQDKSNEQLRSQANQTDSNQTMRHEQAKGEVSGQRDEKGAIGGGNPSQTGEPGRARNELEEGRRPTGKKSEAGNKSEFDATTGSR